MPLQSQTLLNLPAESQIEVSQQIANSIRNHGRAFFRVLGTSMSPAVPHESIVNVVAVDIATVRTGMLAAFLLDDRIFVHRVVFANPDRKRLVTRGDALPSNDPAITSQEFLGVVTAVIPPARQTLKQRSAMKMKSVCRNLFRSLRA